MKTGGFEPQYGQSQGGIINIITQSAATSTTARSTATRGRSRSRPRAASRTTPRTNKFGKLLHEENYDAGADLGGYVPGLKDKSSSSPRSTRRFGARSCAARGAWPRGCSARHASSLPHAQLRVQARHQRQPEPPPSPSRSSATRR